MAFRRSRLHLAALVVAAAAAGALAPPATPAHSAAPSPARRAPLSFLAIGDWGRGGSRNQKEVAAAMTAWAERNPVAFVISTGDNFYEDGVGSVTDAKWRTSFEDVYWQSALRVPWYVALGNHDYRGSVESEIAYSTSSARWRMPARTYTFTEAAGDGTRVQFFVLDTTPFLDTYRSIFSRTKVAGQDPAAQRAWLEKELAASMADWKIVVGHHAIRSCGPHGDSRELVRDILPLLERYGVRVYLNGHDHGLQHLASGGIDYFTSGGGSEVTRVAPDARTVWARAATGFMAFSAAPDAIRVKVVDAGGVVRHEASVPRGAAR